MIASVQCNKEYSEVDGIRLKKGHWYRAETVHDILFIHGEGGTLIEVLYYYENPWFFAHIGEIAERSLVIPIQKIS